MFGKEAAGTTNVCMCVYILIANKKNPKNKKPENVKMQSLQN